MKKVIKSVTVETSKAKKGPNKIPLRAVPTKPRPISTKLPKFKDGMKLKTILAAIITAIKVNCDVVTFLGLMFCSTSTFLRSEERRVGKELSSWSSAE